MKDLSAAASVVGAQRFFDWREIVLKQSMGSVMEIENMAQGLNTEENLILDYISLHTVFYMCCAHTRNLRPCTTKA